MAIGNPELPVLRPVGGIRIGTVNAQIRKPVGDDLVVFELCADAAVAAVFTSNQFCAAPVHVARAHLASGMAKGYLRYLIINTGNANAGTGSEGMAIAQRMCEAVNVDHPDRVMPFSTGVIGETLPVERIEQAVPHVLQALAVDNWMAAASGIMTTDTRPKGSSRQLSIDNSVVTITGISKGAGMICPNMATMLGYVGCDATVARDDLQSLLQSATDQSFNRITIDGDTSTNDACVLVATGASSAATLSPAHPQWAEFTKAVTEVFEDLAVAIVLDGEGATKLITVLVEDAFSDAEASNVAYTVAHSPLVKTAFFASDPNWGRILAAVGRAKFDEAAGALDLNAVRIDLNDLSIVANGGRDGSYTEAAGKAVMDNERITVRIRLGRGNCTQRVWTCDLSYDYVKINAEYRS